MSTTQTPIQHTTNDTRWEGMYDNVNASESVWTRMVHNPWLVSLITALIVLILLWFTAPPIVTDAKKSKYEEAVLNYKKLAIWVLSAFVLTMIITFITWGGKRSVIIDTH